MTEQIPDLENLKSAVDALLAFERSFYEAVDRYRQKTVKVKATTGKRTNKYLKRIEKLRSVISELVDSIQKGFQQVLDEKDALQQLKSLVIEAMDEAKKVTCIEETTKKPIQPETFGPLLEKLNDDLQRLQLTIQKAFSKGRVNVASFKKRVENILKSYNANWSNIEDLVTQCEAGIFPNEAQKHVGFLLNNKKSIEELMDQVKDGRKLRESVAEIFLTNKKWKSAFSDCILDLRKVTSLIGELVKVQGDEVKKIRDTFEEWSRRHRDLIKALRGVKATADLEGFLTDVRSDMDRAFENDQTHVQAFKSEIDEMIKRHADECEQMFERVVGIIEESESSFNAQTKAFGEKAQSINELSRETIEKLDETAKKFKELIDQTSGLIKKLKSCLKNSQKTREALTSVVENSIQSKKKFEEAIGQEMGFDELKPIFDDLAKNKEELSKALNDNEGSINKAATVLEQIMGTLESFNKDLQNLRSTFGEKRKQFDVVVKKQGVILSQLMSLFGDIQNLGGAAEKISKVLEVRIQEVKGAIDEGFKIQERCLDSLKAPVAKYMRLHGLMIQTLRFTIDALQHIAYGLLSVVEQVSEPALKPVPTYEPSPKELEAKLEVQPEESESAGEKVPLTRSKLERIREKMPKHGMPEPTVKHGKSLLEKIRKELSRK